MEGEYTPYQCHKKVHAKLMTWKEYREIRGIEQTYKSEDDLVYSVIYDRAGPDHYMSWSPKEVFEKGYSEINKEGY